MHFIPLHPCLGVEVGDCDPWQPIAPDQIAALQAALDDHHLLLFRGYQPLAPERQVEIGSWFGKPMDNGGGKWTTLDNKDAAGRDELLFHSDLSYTDHPIHVISLHASVLPEGGTVTHFASGAWAWATLPDVLKRRLDGLTLRHHFQSSRFAEWPVFIADHPLCRPHPRTGQPILYATEHHAERLLECDAAESEEVLKALFAWLYAPEHIYRHHWQPYDLVIWSNQALQHARPEQADPAKGARIMQRVAMSDVSFPALIELARHRQSAMMVG